MKGENKMKNCKNCGKPIETGIFCNPKCEQAYYKEPVGAKPLEVNEQNMELKENKETPLTAYKIELEMLKESINCHVELQMSRGSPIRGIIKGFDLQYGKIAVEQDLGEETRITIVKLTYVSAFSIFKKNNKLLLTK